MKQTIFKINGEVDETLFVEIKYGLEKFKYLDCVEITKITFNEDEVVVTWDFIYKGNKNRGFTHLKTVEEWEKLQRGLLNFDDKLVALDNAISELDDAAYEVDAMLI